ILIDGKPFFFDDPSLATKNLPAKIIDKIRIIDRLSDEAQFTGIYDGVEESVIDLKLKPGMLDGAFGNVTGGGGTQQRYQGTSMVGKYKERYQLSLIANVNNTNNRSFADLEGDFLKSMQESISSGSSSNNMSIGNTSFREGGRGITQSQMGGVNLTGENRGSNFKYGVSYFYGYTDNSTHSDRYRQTFLKDSSFFRANNTDVAAQSQSHRITAEGEWFITDRSSILTKSYATLSAASSGNESPFKTDGFFGAPINEGNSRSSVESISYLIRGSLLYRHKFKKKGRTFTINLSYSLSDRIQAGTNYSFRQNYRNSRPSSTTLIDRFYHRNSDRLALAARAVYTEPLGKNWSLGFAYRYGESYSNSTKNTFSFRRSSGERYWDERYSNSFNNIFVSQIGEINLSKKEKRYNYTVGVNLQPYYTQSIGLGLSEVRRSVLNLSPSFMYRYRFGKGKYLRINYRGRTRQPTVTQLQPVPTTYSALYIREGNPDLLSEFLNKLTIIYRNSNSKKGKSLSVRFVGDYYLNKIVNRVWYDPEGVRYSKPINENGVYSLMLSVMHSSQIGNSNFGISSYSRASYYRGVSAYGQEYEDTDISRTSKFTISERFRVIYRGSRVEGNIGFRVAYTSAQYSTLENIGSATWNNSLSLYLNWSLPLKFNLVSDFSYRFYAGYGSDLNRENIVWNGELYKLVLKERGSIGVQIYDILNQTESIVRYTTDNYLEDIYSNTLQRYLLLKFTYRFGQFGQK
ncbi:MAG: outer membrane beta-barrel protein, partial [Bacteroidales bacterium]